MKICPKCKSTTVIPVLVGKGDVCYKCGHKWDDSVPSGDPPKYQFKPDQYERIKRCTYGENTVSRRTTSFISS